MRLIPLLLGWLFFALCWMSCQKNPPHQTMSKPDYQKIAAQAIGQDQVTLQLSPDSTYILATHQEKLAEGAIKEALLYALVMEAATGKVLWQKNIPGGQVRWANAQRLEIFEPSEAPSSERPVYFYDLKDKELMKASELPKQH